MQPWQIFPLPKAAPKWEQEAEAYWNRNPALAAEHIFPPNRKAADKTDEEAGNHTNYQTQKINQCHPEVLCGAWNSVGKYGGSVKLQKGLSAAAVPKSPKWDASVVQTAEPSPSDPGYPPADGGLKIVSLSPPPSVLATTARE